MLSQFIEAADRSPLRRVYIVILVGFVAFMVAATAIQQWGPVGKPVISDFDAFYMAGQLALRGQYALAYDFDLYTGFQRELLAGDRRLTWSYPPPFGLVTMPLALVPRGPSFLLFEGLTVASYLWVLNRIAGRDLVTALALLVLPVSVVLFFGQNGLLTGTLAGLVCLGLRDRKGWAGVPLGLMIIKPHLALALGVYVLASRQWRVLAVTLATLAAASLLPMLVFGPGVWSAFLGGISTTAGLLREDFYPFYRMVSTYGALRSAGLTANFALAGQAVIAIAALALVVVATLRLPSRSALGVAALVSLMMTPYAYDYDTPVMGIGLVLLLPDLRLLARPWERSFIYALFIVAAGFGLAATPAQIGQAGQSPAGLLLLIMVAMVWTVLRRARRPAGGREIVRNRTLA